MSLNIDPRSQRAILKIKSLKRATDAAIERASYKAGKTLSKETSKEILRKPKGGKLYIRRDRAGRRRRHIASAPGETHANMTGALRRSLGFKVRGSELEFGYGVQSAQEAPNYAAFVEMGTRLMKARPSLLNGIRDNQGKVVRHYEAEINKAMK